MRWFCVVFVVLCLVLGFHVLPQTLANSRVVVYDFLANAQSGTWAGWEPTASHPLTFGNQSFTAGFAMNFSGILEDGQNYSNAVEAYVPSAAPSGITGDYYHITVPAQAQLELIYGFKQGANATDGVVVGVAYAEENPSSPVLELLTQSKTYDGTLGTATIDLSAYAGQVGGFQLFVRSGATATADALVWVKAAMTVPQGVAGSVNTWSQVSTSLTPPARFSHAMAAIPSGVLLFGGWDSSYNALNDTWLFNDSTQSWSHVFTSLAPSGGGAMAAFTSGDVLYFGGYNSSGPLNETWRFSITAQSWSQVSTSLAPSGDGAMAALPSGDVLYFGGYGGSVPLNETWRFNITTQSWSQVSTSLAPSGGGAMAALPSGDVLFFGGYGGSGPLNDTWRFNITTQSWSQLSTSPAPPGRWGHAMAATPSGVLLFGGIIPSMSASGGYSIDDTWRFDAATNTWSQVSTSLTPSARYHHAMAAIPSGVLLFGGKYAIGIPGPGDVYDDTWRFGQAAPTPTASPSPIVSPTPSPTSNLSFPDVPLDYWAYPEIMSLVGAEVINGYPDGAFKPEFPVTRAEFAKMALLSLGYALEFPESPSFPDVAKEEWYYGYVEGAVMHGLVKGYPDGTFQPQGNITIAEILTVVVRAQGWEEVAPPGPPPYILLHDRDDSVRAITAEDWYYGTVGAAAQYGLLLFPDKEQIMMAGGGSGEYEVRFNTAATRAQTAIFLARMRGVP